MSLSGFFAAADPGKLSGSPRDLIVYVHGYNNSFSDAAKRAAVFAVDLQPNSAPFTVIYSWPSAQKLLSYWKDEDSVQLNQPNLRRFLYDIHHRTHADRTILVGHSMGCRALTFALRDYFFEELITQGRHPKPLFDELIFIEPDVNAEYFRENLLAAKALCTRITIYNDSYDVALKASHIVHQYQSLGLSRDYVGKGVDVIDASAARKDFLGHSYDGPLFFADLRQLLKGVDAAKRTTLVTEKDVYALKKTS